MAKDGKLHASGDLERRTRQWWTARHPTDGGIRDIIVCGDGGVNVMWNDGEEAGKFHISGQLLYAETK